VEFTIFQHVHKPPIGCKPCSACVCVPAPLRATIASSCGQTSMSWIAVKMRSPFEFAAMQAAARRTRELLHTHRSSCRHLSIAPSCGADGGGCTRRCTTISSIVSASSRRCISGDCRSSHCHDNSISRSIVGRSRMFCSSSSSNSSGSSGGGGAGSVCGEGAGGSALVADLRSRGLVYDMTDNDVGIALDIALAAASATATPAGAAASAGSAGAAKAAPPEERASQEDSHSRSSQAAANATSVNGLGQPQHRPPAVYCGFDPTAR
jgi:hypothetical protein